MDVIEAFSDWHAPHWPLVEACIAGVRALAWKIPRCSYTFFDNPNPLPPFPLLWSSGIEAEATVLVLQY